MDDMQQKLGQILGDPGMMSKIMELASSLEGGSGQGAPEVGGSMENIPDLRGLPGSIDNNQQALLRALTPYLSSDRVSRLERAMRAAGMARMASSFLGSGGLQLLTGG